MKIQNKFKRLPLLSLATLYICHFRLTVGENRETCGLKITKLEVPVGWENNWHVGFNIF